MLRHLQTKQFLRYWKTRTNAGAWARNTDIEGHAAACHRAQKANPNTVSSGSFKEMNDFRLTHDREHQRDHKYDPTDLATGTAWMVDTIDSWILSEDGEIADIVSQLLVQEGFEGIADAITVNGRIDAAMLSEKIRELSGGHTEVPREKIETSIQEWRATTDLAVRLNCPHCQLPDTNTHYRHYCTEPSVVAARLMHI